MVTALLLLELLLPHLAFAADPSHLVTELPGQPLVAFKQYAGEITVNSTAQKALFYWFYEANHANYSSLPLAIWFNGGPGCSSVGNGALGELGPFRTNDSGTGLIFNKFSWNQAANVIFLESPADTGFSYSNTSSTYSDEQTASDALSFILEWLKRFPEYSRNPFYLLGESYAGHYVPTLAAKILSYNKKNQRASINFKGFAIGNPWTDAYYDNRGDTEFFYSHALIADETYKALIQNCDFARDLPIDEGDPNPKCQNAVREMNEDLNEVDYYNVYARACNTPGGTRKRIMFKEMLAAAYDPCLDSIYPYLNSEKVQRALHVKRPVTWTSCSGKVSRSYPRKDIITSMIPLYRELLQHGLKIFIYSGDLDGVVSTIGTRMWVKHLNLTVETPWYAWNFKNQVGGWTETYSSGFTYATIRGAGHMAPKDKPEQSLVLFQHFLTGEKLPGF